MLVKELRLNLVEKLLVSLDKSHNDFAIIWVLCHNIFNITGQRPR